MRVSLCIVAAIAAMAAAVASAGTACGGNPSPSIGQLLTCTTVGEDVVEVPSGSTDFVTVVIAGGGGSSVFDGAPGRGVAGNGGKARNMTAVMRVPSGTTHLLVTVGDAGKITNGKTTSAATGGNASAVIALDVNGNALALLVISGGGGGAGVATVPSGCTPFGGSSDNNDAYRTYPLTTGYLLQGTGGPVCSSVGVVFSTGVSIGPTSAGLGGVSAPFIDPPPAPAQRATSQSRSVAWYADGTFGVNVTGGEYGQNRSDVALGAIAAGGEGYFDDDAGALCSGGGGWGYGGGAGGSYAFADGTCSGGGGSGGGWYVNTAQSLFYDQYNYYATGDYGTPNNQGMVSIRFLAPSATATTTISPSRTASTTRSASVSASVSVSATNSFLAITPSVTPSESVSPSGTASETASPSVSGSVSASTSVSPSNAASGSLTGSVTASSSISASVFPSTTVSPSESPSETASPSVSHSESVTATATKTESRSASPTLTESVTVTPSRSPSVTSSGSITPSRTASPSISPSRMASVTVSPSVSASTSVSPSRTGSVTASDSVSPTMTASESVSSSVSPSVSRTATCSASLSPTSSRTGTPSETMTSTETGTMTSTATMTVSATNTVSGTSTPGVVVPSLALSLTLVGGDEDALRAGTGQLLRQAVNQLVGVDGAASSFTELVTNYTVTPVEDVYALANATANSTRVNASDILPGSAQKIAPNDPDLNAPLYRRRRQLQAGQPTCNPVVLPTNGTITVPFTTAYMMVQIPQGYFASNGAFTAQQIAALIAQLQAQFYLQLANPGVVTTAFSGFVSSWSQCTGMPPSAGVIAAIAAPAAVNVPSPTPVPGPDNSKMRNGVLIGVITGGLFIMLVVAIAMGCARRRRIFAAKDAFMFIGGAHECELSQVWDWPIRVPGAGSNPDAPAWTIRACPHITLKYTAGLALRAAGFELTDQLLKASSLVFKDRVHSVREEGDKPLGDLDINADTAKDVEGIILLANAAAPALAALHLQAAGAQAAVPGAPGAAAASAV